MSQPERRQGATDFAELHAWIAERDIPSTPEVEILARSRDQVLGLLADVQYDNPTVRGLDERIDALLSRDARVEIARSLHSDPAARAAAALDRPHGDLVALFERQNTVRDGRLAYAAEYLVVLGVASRT